jgi:hypothetical protein
MPTLPPPVTSVHHREAREAVEELLAPLGPNPYALGRSITRSSSASHGWSWVLWVQRCRIASRLVTMGLASLLGGWDSRWLAPCSDQRRGGLQNRNVDTHDFHEGKVHAPKAGHDRDAETPDGGGRLRDAFAVAFDGSAPT